MNFGVPQGSDTTVRRVSVSYEMIVTLALAVLAVVGNYFAVTLFHGIDFLFGSIAALIAVRIFGISYGCFVAFVGSTVTYFDWGHPYAIIIFTLEIAVVGLVSKRVGNLVLADAIYWLFVGGGIAIFFYSQFVEVPTESAAYIALKQAVNGMLNAVLAGFIMELCRVYVPALRQILPVTSLRTVLFYSMAVVIMSFSTTFVLLQTKFAYDGAVNRMNTAMSVLASWADSELEENDGDETLTRNDFEQRVASVLSRIDSSNFPLSGISIGIIYSDGRVGTISGNLRSITGKGSVVPGENGVDQWIPASNSASMLRERDTAYVLRVPSAFAPTEREILVEISASALIDILQSRGRMSLSLLALILGAITVASRFLTHGLTSFSSQFVQIASETQTSIMRGSPLPRMSNVGILELDAIGGVVRQMSSQLAHTFREHQELNHTLEERIKLRTSELSLLSQVAKQTTNVVIVTDPDGKVTWVNDACTNVTGYNLDEMLGKTPGEVLQKGKPTEDILENMRQGILKRKGFHVELINHKKDGTPYWIEIRCNPLFDKSGNHTGFIAIENDVTDRRETSLALQQTLERLDLASSLASMGVWSYDNSTRKVEWNDQNFIMHGIPQTAENKYELWEENVHPEDLSTMNTLLRNARQDCDTEFEYRFMHPELGQRLISCRVQVTSIAKDGSRYYTGANLDITEVRKTNRRLENAATKTAAIVDNALDSIITIDSKGLITSFNYAAETMFRYRASEVIGENVNILMSAKFSDHHSGYIAAYLKGREARMIDKVTEVEAMRANGDVFPVELAVSKSVEDTGVVFIGIVRDLTERRKIDLMKSEFLAMVSHELRTPLTSIQGTLSLVKAGIFGELDQRGQRIVSASLGNAETLGSMVDEILDLEKLSSGKLEVYIEQINLSDLLNQTINSTQSYSDKFSVHLSLQTPVPEILIQADPKRAGQVLTNLISNAVKFSPTGDVVRVEVMRNKGYMRVSVIDNGPGIPADKHDLLFQKFSQIDASDSRHNRGTGLGLAISRELMNSMEGRIGFTSIQGEGSTFWAEFRIDTEIQVEKLTSKVRASNE
jgi:PAS domain S-box-containing protein